MLPIFMLMMWECGRQRLVIFVFFSCPGPLVNNCQAGDFRPDCVAIPGEADYTKYNNECCDGWSLVMGICTSKYIHSSNFAQSQGCI